MLESPASPAPQAALRPHVQFAICLTIADRTSSLSGEKSRSGGELIYRRAQFLDVKGLGEDRVHVHFLVGFANFG